MLLLPTRSFDQQEGCGVYRAADLPHVTFPRDLFYQHKGLGIYHSQADGQAGKSTLLSAMLGEVPQLSGRTALAGSVAYCAQQPWILHGTVQDGTGWATPGESWWKPWPSGSLGFLKLFGGSSGVFGFSAGFVVGCANLSD